MKVNPAAKAWLVDTGERVGSTLGEAALGWLATYLAHLPAIYVLLFAPALTVLKAQLAKLVTDSVSPASLAPAQQPGQAEQDAPPNPDPAAGGDRIPLDVTSAADHLAVLPAADGPKLGRLPKPPDPRDFRLARYLTAALPKSPGKVNWAAAVAVFAMLLNDRIGDCAEAAWLHIRQLWMANVGRVFNPTDAQALALYQRIAGYNPNDPSTDRGTVLRDLLKAMKVPFVAVDPRNHEHVKAAIALFGGLYVGVELTQAAYREQGVHWRRVHGANGQPDPDLGHCVIYTGYDHSGVKTVTWGQEGTATWGWHDECCVEAWAIVSADWINAAGSSPTGLDLAKLQADLAAL